MICGLLIKEKRVLATNVYASKMLQYTFEIIHDVNMILSIEMNPVLYHKASQN